MSVPDLRGAVADLFNTGKFDITTKAGAGRFTEAVAVMLHANDANFGHLAKPPDRTHVVGPDGRRHPVDVLRYRSNGQRVDFISDAGEPGAHLSWQPGREHEYSEADWYAPVGVSTGGREPGGGQAPIVDFSAVLEAIDKLRRDTNERLDAIERRPVPQPQPIVFPNCPAAGNIKAPWPIGNAPFGVTLTPVAPGARLAEHDMPDPRPVKK
jgi:hypothetical protein